jgi:uncharacterized damage-inducible protein DinB
MSELKKLLKELKGIHEGEAFHGPSLRELLSGVTATEAATRPIPGAHSIWELVLHITAWEGVFNERLKGKNVDTPEEGDFPPVVEKSEAAWEKALARLESTHQQLLELVSSLSETALHEPVVGSKYSIGFMLRGAIRHHVYHAGQIGLLKKAF